jgi:hypothetical protein
MKTIQVKVTESQYEALKGISGAHNGASAVRTAIKQYIVGELAASALKRHGIKKIAVKDS